jgi:hypothetical protein
MTPDRQRDRMLGAEPPMDASGNKENRSHKNSADAADYCDGAATGKTIQVCLMPVQYDQYSKDREADRLADQAHSSCDPLKHLSTEHPVARFDFRLRNSSEPEAEIGGGVHGGWSFLRGGCWFFSLAIQYKSISRAGVSGCDEKSEKIFLIR